MKHLKKRPRGLTTSHKEFSFTGQYKSPRLAVLALALGAVAVLTLAVSASNTVLHGHLTVTKNRIESKASNSAPKGASGKTVHAPAQSSDLVDKYGTPATLPAVAKAIKKAENATGDKNAEWAAGAKAAADRDEALSHGYWMPGADPMQAIMYGYVPPGMPQEQAAMLYRTLPHLPKMPGPTTPEDIARMAREPIEPVPALPDGTMPARIRAANEQQFASYTRERFGPIYIPPLHRDPGWLAQHGHRTPTGYVVTTNNQMSLIPAQYGYDGGTRPSSVREMTDSSGNIVTQYTYDPYGRQARIGGTGPDADFGYAGYYLHQRSGLNLAVHRAYNPASGRWLNRDPIQDQTFALTPRSPEPSAPSHNLISPTGPVQVFQDPRLRWTLLPEANQYAYVANNPINYRDPLGLFPPAFPPDSSDWGAVSNCIDWCAFYSGSDLAARGSDIAKEGGCPRINNCMKNCLQQAALGKGPGVYGSGFYPYGPNPLPRLTWP